MEAIIDNARQHPRITEVQDIRATFGSGGDSRGVDRVLNLSEGGMLVADDTLNVGQSTAFQLSGPSFHYAGVAEVMHLTNETTGLRFLSWQTRDNRPIRSLIEQRSEWQAPANVSDQRDPHVIRRVAVLTGPTRHSSPQTPKPPVQSGPSADR
jgi:PilZ domain